MDNVFAVTSGKGGVGKTTTAINLAVAVGSEDRPVVVVDADLGMPDVGTFLDLASGDTIHDVLAGEASIESALSGIAPGVDALAGSRDLERFPDADPDELGPVVDQLAEQYAFVFIDTGGGLSYEAVLPLELADAAVLVTSPQPAAIDNTKKSKQLADRVGVSAAGVVITHSNERTDPAAIADEIGVPLLGSVPADPIVPGSTERCQSLFEYAADSEATEAYRGIGAALADWAGDDPNQTTDVAPNLADDPNESDSEDETEHTHVDESIDAVDETPPPDSTPERDAGGGDEHRGDVDSESSDDHPGEIGAPTEDFSPDQEPGDGDESSDSSVESDGVEDVDRVDGSDDVDAVEIPGRDDNSAGTSERDESDRPAVAKVSEKPDEPNEEPNRTESTNGRDTDPTEKKRSGGFFSRLFGWLR
jgi:septum site-determining protein MinD